MNNNKIIMAQGLSNSEIAEIYAGMMSGDRSALFKLQQVTSTPHPIDSRQKRAESKPPTASQVSRSALSESKEEHFKEVSSLPSIPATKQQLFLNAIKQGAKFAPPRSEKSKAQPKHFRLVNSSNEVYPSERKDKTLFRDKQSIDEAPAVPPDRARVTSKPYALPRVHHKLKEITQLPKVQSTHLQAKKPEVAKESAKQPQSKQLDLVRSKIALKKEKVDFKQIIGKNKKLREQFELKNEQERQVQKQIMEYHLKTKDILANVASKYSLNFNNHARYLRRKKSDSPPPLKESQSQKKLSPFKAAMKGQGERCSQIQAELAHLKSMLAHNQKKIKNLQREGEQLLYARYLHRYGGEIQEEEEEEGDTVQPLQENVKDHNRYKYSMARTREKKWSLIQRTEYEAQRTHSLEESRQVNTTSRISNNPPEESPNRVTVNQRLKDLLFT